MVEPGAFKLWIKWIKRVQPRHGALELGGGGGVGAVGGQSEDGAVGEDEALARGVIRA